VVADAEIAKCEKEAARAIYTRLRREGVSHYTAFRAAVEMYRRRHPELAGSAIEATVWEAIQAEKRVEIGTNS